MKTAKSIEVARLALAGQPGGLTVSTMAEAEYFVGHGQYDLLYAVGITPQKLADVGRLNASGADIAVIYRRSGHGPPPLPPRQRRCAR